MAWYITSRWYRPPPWIHHMLVWGTARLDALQKGGFFNQKIGKPTYIGRNYLAESYQDSKYYRLLSKNMKKNLSST